MEWATLLYCRSIAVIMNYLICGDRFLAARHYSWNWCFLNGFHGNLSYCLANETNQRFICHWGEPSCFLSLFLQCVLTYFQALLKTAFRRLFLTYLSNLPLNSCLFIGRTLSFPNSVANSGPFGSSMPIQMPEFSFFPANRGRPYADSWRCQNISMYFLSLPGEREKISAYWNRI